MLPDDPATLVRTALADALALVLPVVCAGCGTPDTELCAGCTPALAPRPAKRVIEAAGGAFVVWSGLPFEGVTARVLRAIKEEGRTPLARHLAPALGAARRRLAAPGVAVVPMPTSRAAYRRRGFRVPELLAARAGLPVARVLRPVRRIGDQRGLSREARHANVAQSLEAARATPRRVIVLDDVITTGASLADAVRALRDAGAEVVGAITVAATPRRLNDSGPPGVAFETHR